MEKIIVDVNLSTKIEALQYEVESRKDVLAHIISSGMAVSGDRYDKYQAEYLDFFKQYNKAKQELVDTYLKDAAYANWNLNFRTRELTVE